LLPIKDDIPTRRFPIVTVLIIAINVVMFFGLQKAHISTDGAHVDELQTVKYAAIPYEITHPGKHCGVAAVVDTPVAPLRVQDTQAPLCEGQQVGVDTPAGPVTGTVKSVSPADQPPTILTIFTAMFMHAGLLHILFNMVFLWIFGNNIEDSMNRAAFVVFYLAGGVVATLAQTAFDTSSSVPTLGASGAIAAVLGGYALLYPRARVLTLVIIVFFVTILRLPALLVLGVWFLLQVLDFSQVASGPFGSSGGVAYLAHIGGFLFGLATIKFFATNVHEDYDRPHRLPVY
jgi:membrane associated rhomboid family serine protease